MDFSYYPELSRGCLADLADAWFYDFSGIVRVIVRIPWMPRFSVANGMPIFSGWNWMLDAGLDLCGFMWIWKTHHIDSLIVCFGMDFRGTADFLDIMNNEQSVVDAWDK